MTSAMPDPDRLLAALDEEQRRVARQVTGPLCVLAGAGTGKTRAITYRIAHSIAVGAFDPANILAVTFTSRAAAEMRQRLRDLGAGTVQARTFHAAALRQLAFFWPTVIGGTIPPIQEHKGSLVATAAARLSIGVDRTAVRDLAAEIEWAKVSLISPENYATKAVAEDRILPADQDAKTVSQLLKVYEECKNERGVIDFEDVLLLMAGALQEREDIARQVRNQYRSFVVDEYQDVSPLQQFLLEQWLGGRNDICVVGDVAQTIYSFTGATPKYLTDFAQRHRGANVVQLNRDYRSTPQVVAVANQVLRRARGSHGRELIGTVVLQAQRPSGPAVRFLSWDDDIAEAEGLVDQVKRLLAAGVPTHEIAVLYRTNSQSEAFEQAFAQAGIGVVLRGGQRFFDRDEIRRAIVLLRANAHTAKDPWEEVTDTLGSLGWSQEAPQTRGAVRERWDALDALANLAQERFAAGVELPTFVAELMERAQAQHAPVVAGVTLSSLHAAKGLEWDAVLLAGVSEGLLPISLAQTPTDIEEERRLLYVGITRAREHLVISYSQGRPGASRRSRKRSRFLDGIWPEDAPSRQPNSRRGRSRQAAEDFVADNPPEVLARFETLRYWRNDMAKYLSKPAYTVLNDQTLRDISVRNPGDLQQLNQVRGIGMVKLDSYGAQILALLRGEQVPIPPK